MENKQRKIIQEEVRNEFGELEGMFIPNYRKKENFLSNAEYKFYKTLKKIYEKNSNIEIFVQVALNRIIEFNNERAKKEFSYYKLNERSIDFVIYDTGKNNFSILYCIELNDKSHEENQERVKRDIILETIFKTANIELKMVKLKDIKRDISNGKEYFNLESVKQLLNIKD